MEFCRNNFPGKVADEIIGEEITNVASRRFKGLNPGSYNPFNPMANSEPATVAKNFRAAS